MISKQLLIVSTILFIHSTASAWGIYTDNKDGTISDGVSSNTNASIPKYLMWTKNANPANERMSYGEAEDYIEKMNSGKVENFGYTDWKIPTKGEMDHHLEVKFKFIGQPKTLNKLPPNHPFTNFSKSNSYWMRNLFGSWDPTMILNIDRYIWPVRIRCTGTAC